MKIVKYLYILVCLCALPLFGGLTSITDTLYNPDGTKFTGRAEVALKYPNYNTSGTTLTTFKKTFTIPEGVVSFSLEANTAISPSGTSYAVQFYGPKLNWSETWVVPESVSAVTIRDIRSTVVPSVSATFNYSQITGLTAGDILYGTSTGYAARLGKGANDQILKMVGGVPTWSTADVGISAHATTHKNGGNDEVATAVPASNAIPKAGLGGTLDAAWIPTLNQNTTGTAAGLTSQYINWNATTGGSSIANKPTLGDAALKNTGTIAGTVAAGDDSRFGVTAWSAITDKPSTFEPSIHASSHVSGAIDALSGTFGIDITGNAATASGVSGKTFLGTATQIPQFSGTPTGAKCVHTDVNGNLVEAGADCNTSGMTYPGAGVPNSTGSAWGTSYAVGTGANNLVQLDGSGRLPAVSAANLTNFPTLNQNTTGTAAGLTSQYIDWSTSSGGTSIANKPTLGDSASKNVGTTTGTVAAGDDSRFTNARTPTAHASSHVQGASDALSGTLNVSVTGNAATATSATSATSATTATTVSSISSHASTELSDSSTLVRGASALSTAGYVPQVDVAGALKNSQIFCDATGCGVGTASPAATLHADATSGNILALTNAASNKFTVASTGALSGGFASGASYTVDQYGNAKFGQLVLDRTSVPADTSALAVVANTGSDATLGTLSLSIGAHPSATGSSRYGYISVGDSAALRPLALNTNGAGAFGKVGIGTTSPTNALDVAGSVGLGGATYKVTFSPSASQTASYTLTWPIAQGTSGQTLLNDGSGNLSWGISAGYAGGALGAITVNNSTTPPTIDVVSSVVPLLAGANAWTGLNSWTPTTNQSITAATDTVLCNGSVVQVTPSSNLTLTSAATIANASASGATCTIVNLSTSYSLTLQDEAILTGSNLRLNGGRNYTLLPRAAMVLQYNSSLGDWTQIGGENYKVVKLGSYEVGAENASAAIATADLTNHAFIINDSRAKTLTAAYCISDAGDQTVTVKISTTTLFSIHCVATSSFSTATTDGTTGYILPASMGSTSVAAHSLLDLSGTANASTKDVKLTVYASVN